MTLSKERMAAYQRERRAKLEVLKVDPEMKVVMLAKDVPMENLVWESELTMRLQTLEHAMVDLQARVSRLENPDEVSRKQALKPGGHPNELYGA